MFIVCKVKRIISRNKVNLIF